MEKEIKTAQQKANSKQDLKRRGAPSFSAIRLDSQQQKDDIDDIFNQFGTRKSALILAAKLLKKELDKT